MGLLLDGDPDRLITITLYKTIGEEITKMPAKGVRVTAVTPQTLVLDFGRKDGMGLFETLDLSSAKFLVGESLTLRAGTEVAQVDWDGFTTRVDWVRVEEVRTVSDTPIIRLADSIKKGASGGGVFWH